MAESFEQVFNLRAPTDDLDRLIRALDQAAGSSTKFSDAMSFTQRDVAMMNHGVGLGTKAVLGLSDAELKTARSAAGLAREEHAAGDAARDAGRGSDEAGHAVVRLEGATKQASVAWEMFKGSFLGNLAYDAIRSIGQELLALPGKMLNAAAGAEHMDRALELTFGPARGKQLADYAGRISSLTFADDDQIKGWILDMGKAGVAFGDLDKNMALAATMAAKSKDPIGAMSMTIDALTEATRRGSISNRQLRPLGIGPEQLKTLDQFKGLTTKQLNKELETGKVSLVDLRRLLEGNNNLLGTTGVAAAGQMGIALKNLRNTPEQLFQEFAKTDAFGALAAKFSELATSFGPDGPAGKKIVDFMGKLGTQAVTTFNSIDWKAWGDRLLAFLQALPAVLDKVYGAAKAVGAVLGVGAEVVTRTMSPAAAIGTTPDYIKNSGLDQEPAFAKAIKNSPGWIRSKILGRLGMLDAGKDAAAGLQLGIEAGAPGAAQAAATMATDAHGAAKTALDSHSPSRLAMTLGEDYAEGWGIGLNSGLERVNGGLGADAFASPPSSGGGGGATSIVLNVTTTVHAGGNAHEVASTTAEAIRDMLPGALHSLFLRFKLQGGA